MQFHHQTSVFQFDNFGLVYGAKFKHLLFDVVGKKLVQTLPSLLHRLLVRREHRIDRLVQLGYLHTGTGFDPFQVQTTGAEQAAAFRSPNYELLFHRSIGLDRRPRLLQAGVHFALHLQIGLQASFTSLTEDALIDAS
ncbi:hypothetical protein T4C_8758 [Trichinella pseudospiralis]|uniref:Uncharacterized protein n=1 Tax=Trichinella pseudospiralis TaxID=6337 RepID=A0A0V1J1G6_TRIPS|nr:hypothetical protein T4C_8758 [Trichinella pseudospiralis]